MGAFNNPVILPQQQRSPWETAIPNLLTTLALSKIQHNWAMDVKDKQLEAQKIATQESRQFQSTEAQKTRKFQAGQAKEGREFTANQNARNRQTQFMTTAMGIAAKPKQMPYALAESDGIALGVFNKQTGELERFDKSEGSGGIPSKLLSRTQKTNEDGTVTTIVRDKRNGDEIWRKTDAIGRPGKTAEPSIPEKVSQRETAENLAYQRSARLYDDASKAVSQRAKDNFQLDREYKKNPELRERAIVQEVGERAGVFEKFHKAMLWKQPWGEIVIVDPADNNRILWSKSGVKY